MTEPCSCGPGYTCGCCEGTEPLTPQPIANRPGLDALSYRIGTHASFLETMQARLSSNAFPALAGLTTREGSDASLALLDAWAVVADVLTFYQERIANEGYLRTATERRSVLELARLVGYTPRPGVAASTYLAYTLEEKVKPAVPPGAPNLASASLDEPETLIPAGARAQSVPGPGEMPQTFETSEEIAARAAWNYLQVRLTRPQQPEKLTQATKWPVVLYFKGIATNLKPNDPLLIDTGAALPELYRTLKVASDAARDRTRVEVKPWLKAADSSTRGAVSPEPRISVEALQEIVERSSDLDAAGISPGAMTGRVLSALEPLKAALEAGAEEPELRTDVEGILPKLREEHRIAVEKNASRLEPWIDGLTAELDAAVRRPAGTAAAATAPLSGSLELGKITSLTGVLESLGTKPKPQPRSRLHLDRNAKTLFGSGSDLSARLATLAQPELRETFYQAWANVPVTRAPALKVCALRTRASVFGHNAPLEMVRDDSNNDFVRFRSQEWDFLNAFEKVTEEPREIWLDAPYPQILPGSWIVLQRPAASDRIAKLVVTRVQQIGERSRAEYGISAKATRVELTSDWLNLDHKKPDEFDVIRGTAVFAQCEELELAEEPIEGPLCGQRIELAGLYDGLQPGRWLIVTGERAEVGEVDDETGKVIAPVSGVQGAELAMLAGVEQGVSRIKANGPAHSSEIDLPGDRNHTTLILAEPLAYCYKLDTIKIYGNVAHATHGETRFEVLGSGDAAKPHQSFMLKQPPLTWVSAPTPSGVESTLQARVNDVLWHETDCPAGLGHAERKYFVRIGDGGQTTIVFGDGRRGARLPTGPENVRARYRSGIGKEGNVKAGQISQLATRPLGVKDVINPIPATGGAGPESRDQARRNAPLAVMALDRLVSVQDYADFARTFAGVGKASATRLSDGRVQLVHITIAGEDDIPIREDSDLFLNLEEALWRFGEPRQALRLELRQRSFLVVEAEVRALPDYIWDKVEPKIRAAMGEAFGVARRDLGQDAVLSEVYRTIQRVSGVDLVDVNLFARKDPEKLTASLDHGQQPKDAEGNVLTQLPAPRLRARLARIDDQGKIQPAQLLYLTPEVPDTLILKERKT
jgi:hypothetical protein